PIAEDTIASAILYTEYKNSNYQDIIAKIKEKYLNSILLSNLASSSSYIVNSIVQRNVNGDIDDDVLLSVASVNNNCNNISLLNMKVNTASIESIRSDGNFDDATLCANSEQDRRIDPNIFSIV
ncbi:13660_t:CDS:2, partial [Dentiscutata erythropus]